MRLYKPPADISYLMGFISGCNMDDFQATSIKITSKLIKNLRGAFVLLQTNLFFSELYATENL